MKENLEEKIIMWKCDKTAVYLSVSSCLSFYGIWHFILVFPKTIL